MTRHGWMLIGLVSVVLLAGCRQVPLRNGNGEPVPQPQVAKKKDDNLESQLSLARLSERHGQDGYAAQVYEAILRKNPRTVEAHHRLAVIASQKQDFETAERHFQQALEYGPRDPELLADIGYYFYLREQLDDAEKTLRESLAGNPQNKAARNNLALVLGEQGRVVEAMEEFQKVVSEAEAHANMGYILVMLGDIPQAQVEFNTALSMDHTLRSAAEALIQLEEQMKTDPAIARMGKPETTAVARAKAANGKDGRSQSPARTVAPSQEIAPQEIAAQSVTAPQVTGEAATGKEAEPVSEAAQSLVDNSPSKRGNAPQASAFERPHKPADERAAYTAMSTKSDTEPLVTPVVYAEDAAHFQISDGPSAAVAEQPQQEVEPASIATQTDSDHQASDSGSTRRFSLPWKLPRLLPGK